MIRESRRCVEVGSDRPVEIRHRGANPFRIRTSPFDPGSVVRFSGTPRTSSRSTRKDPVSARRTVSEVVRDLEEAPIDGDRYEFEVFLESPESARKRGEDLRPILQEGIPLVESETFRRVKRDVFGVDE